MSSDVSRIFGLEQDKNPLRDVFLGWQCLVRQLIMREERGRPNAGITPEVTLEGESTPFGSLITILNRKPHHSMLPEMQHMVRRTADPAQRLDKAVQFFSSTYFQKPEQFSDMLTCSFAPGSQGAQKIRAAGHCQLDFSAYNQSYSLYCQVWQLNNKNPFYAPTWWHNHLFNPNLSEDCVILGFEPDWARSSSF